MRTILLLHRYLGVAVGLLMTVWCLSGFVMMYQSYPSFTRAERLKGLEPLRLPASFAPDRLELEDDASLAGFRLEMLAGRPVLRVQRDFGPGATFDLASGEPIDEIGVQTGVAVARAYARGAGLEPGDVSARLIEEDQWTVQIAAQRGPMYQVALDDPARTELYVALAGGDIAQQTTGRERWLSWFGAIPHWLYPTTLRRNGELWTQIVVWTSAIGIFLTVTGLVVGATRFGRRRSGRLSPYRGLWFWHHMIGLAFGVVTLTWVASGLLTMGPGNFLASDAASRAREALSSSITGAEAKRFLALAPRLAVGDVVQLQSAPLGGRLFVAAVTRDDRMARHDADGGPAPLTATEALDAMRRATGDRQAVLSTLRTEDAYYYGHHNPVKLPVFRLALSDAKGTALYLDSDTGALVRAVDHTARQRRWLETGLHDLDFAGLRRRPVWDIVVLTLLAGVTAVCATGFWLSLRRIGRDWAAIVSGVRTLARRSRPLADREG